mgnify:CR=1 FL=1
MRNFLIRFLLVTLIMIPTEIFAADYETPHEFSAGDTLSADMINELFSKIELSINTLKPVDLVGTWTLVQTTCLDGGPGNCSSLSMSGMTNSTDGITRYRTDTVIFSNDGDGTYSFSQNTYASLLRSGAGNSSGSGDYTIVDGFALFNDSTHGMGMFQVKKVSPTRIIMSLLNSGSASYNIVRLDKANLAPSTPATLTASASGKTVSLTWTDSSTNETGFKVLRKDSLTGSYSTITTTSADATSYSNTVTAAGSYWYRVSATNSNGDSVASKMVKVDVE